MGCQVLTLDADFKQNAEIRPHNVLVERFLNAQQVNLGSWDIQKTLAEATRMQ